jgi:hypothetical protein
MTDHTERQPAPRPDSPTDQDRKGMTSEAPS